MPSKGDMQVYVPEQEVITLWFYREGDVLEDEEAQEESARRTQRTPLFWADVRADLTHYEREKLLTAIKDSTADIEERLRAENEDLPEKQRLDDLEIKRKAAMEVSPDMIWDALAPFVIDWSVGELVKGKPKRIDPPAIGGGKQFQYISEFFTSKITMHLLTRSEGSVSVDFLGKSKNSPNGIATGSVAVMKQDA